MFTIPGETEWTIILNKVAKTWGAFSYEKNKAEDLGQLKVKAAEAGAPVGTLVRDAFEPGKQAPGRPGVHRWQFRAVAEGSGAVRFVYRRSWEEDSAAARVFTVILSVKQ